MTSPTRKRSDQSRKRLSELKALEIAERARQCFVCTPEPRGSGATCAFLTRSDIVLIGRAVRGGWPVPERKCQEIVEQLFATLESDDDRLALSVAWVVLAMEEQNQRAQHAKL